MTKRKTTIERAARKTPEEPEELRLWRLIADHRDVLIRVMTDWEEFRRAQRRGQTPMKNIPPERRALTLELRSHSEKYLANTIGAARMRLETLDTAIVGLRQNKGKAYALRKLSEVAERFGDQLLISARDCIAEFVKAPNAENRGIATAALLATRNMRPRPIDPMKDLESGDGGVDLDALLQAARNERFAKNESNATVARRIVASFKNMKPHERRLRK